MMAPQRRSRASDTLRKVAATVPADPSAADRAAALGDVEQIAALIQQMRAGPTLALADATRRVLDALTRRIGGTSDQAEPRSFDVMDPARIFAPLPAPVEVIVGCVRAASIALIGGFGSSSKTWQGLDACVSVALGEPWLGCFETVKGPTAFLDFESGSYETRRRLQALARARGIETMEGVDVVSLPGLYLGDPAFLCAVEQLARGRSLIVIDSLRAASLVDENDSRIRIGLDQLRAVAERTSCAFIVLVHAKKTSGATTTIDPREVLRGSSAVFDAADNVFVATLKKDRETFDVMQVKARHGRSVAPFSVRLLSEQGGVLVRANEAAGDQPRVATEDAISGVLQKVRDVVRAAPGCGMRRVRSAVRGTASVVDTALDRLIARGEIVDHAERRGKQIVHRFRLVETAPQ